MQSCGLSWWQDFLAVEGGDLQAALVERLLGRLGSSAGSGVSLMYGEHSLVGCLGGRQDFLAVIVVDLQAVLVVRLLCWQGRSKFAVYSWGILASCQKLSIGRM